MSVKEHGVYISVDTKGFEIKSTGSETNTYTVMTQSYWIRNQTFEQRKNIKKKYYRL